MGNKFAICLISCIIWCVGCAPINSLILYRHNARITKLEELHKDDSQNIKEEDNLQKEDNIDGDIK